MFIGERIILTLWVGGMWAIGYIVAPVLFNMLDDRVLAGTIAGRLFAILSYVGLVAAGLLLVGQISRFAREVVRQWRFWLLLTMLAFVVAGQFILQPMMAMLRDAGLEGEAAQRFGRLHGISSLLFLFNSLGGLVLVVFGLTQRVRS